MQHNRFCLIGDIALNGLFSNETKKNSFRFKGVSDFLQSFDLVIANLETPVKGKNEINEHKNIIFQSDPDPTRNILKNLNIGIVSLANNHIYDCKMSGLKATMSVLDECGINYTGAGWNKSHLDPVYFTLDKIRFAFLAYVDKNTNPRTSEFPELFINYFDENKIINSIREAKKNAENIILSLHWGIDYSHFATPYQVEASYRFADAGADIIMGHHPHTIQMFKEYNGKYIFYSLGGLCFGDYLKNEKLVALPKKSKKSFIPVFNTEPVLESIMTTKELKGNKIILTHRNLKPWLWRNRLFTKLKHEFAFFEFLLDFEEGFVDRTIEYFFGYYNNPFKRLFQLSNLKKIKILFADYRWKRKKIVL